MEVEDIKVAMLVDSQPRIKTKKRSWYIYCLISGFCYLTPLVSLSELAFALITNYIIEGLAQRIAYGDSRCDHPDIRQRCRP